ncbi:MAG: hypothetical protein GY716_15340 [bacterium]|nr:hypothetical protein [bacterium]
MAEATTGLRYRSGARIGDSAERAFAESLRGIALDDADRIYAVGDSRLRVFDARGNASGSWNTARPGYSVSIAPDGGVWVGQRQQVEIFTDEGRLVDTWSDAERLGRVTAIGFAGDDVFLADAQARCIRRYDRKGTWRNDIGDEHRKGGFDIPNGVVDFAVADDGTLHVANPGMHRVERYDADGTLLSRFGHFDGRDPAGFGGCCNPTNVALGREGRVLVSEKAGPRAKVYDRDGQLLAIVAQEEFDKTSKNMDLAVDSTGRVWVADTAKLRILSFVPQDAGDGE